MTHVFLYDLMLLILINDCRFVYATVRVCASVYRFLLCCLCVFYRVPPLA